MREPSHGAGASCEIHLQEPDQVLTVRAGEKSPVSGSHTGQLLCPLWIDPRFWQFFRLSWFLMTLKILRNTDHLFSGLSFKWDFSDVFLMVIPHLWVFVTIAEVKCHSCHIISRVPMYCQHDLSLLILTFITWPRKCRSVCSTIKLLLPLTPARFHFPSYVHLAFNE